MNDQEKLRFLLSHWINHNGEHAAEYHKWIDIAEEFGQKDAVLELKEAIKQMDSVNHHLLAAQELLGGPIKDDSGDHSHPHHH